MRRALRHALSILRGAGVKVEGIRQAGRHTEIVFKDGGIYRMPRGSHWNPRAEHGLRSYIRRRQK